MFLRWLKCLPLLSANSKFLFILVLAGACTLCSFTQGAEFEIDPHYSSVGFRIRHLVSQTRGVFTGTEGKIFFDPAHPEQSRVDATVHTQTITTHHAQRDKHLCADDFFDCKRFPEAHFVSRVVHPAGVPGRFDIDGELTIKGITKPLTIHATLGGLQEDAYGNKRAGFSAVAEINRKDYEITWNETLDNGSLLLGDQVNLEMDIEAVEESRK